MIADENFCFNIQLIAVLLLEYGKLETKMSNLLFCLNPSPLIIVKFLILENLSTTSFKSTLSFSTDITCFEVLHNSGVKIPLPIPIS